MHDQITPDISALTTVISDLSLDQPETILESEAYEMRKISDMRRWGRLQDLVPPSQEVATLDGY
ncbi:hypothetical protein [Microbulbifer sediminum]|uniref:hypothetical protein n=1 Tax=Microbulbifer sediminum TaxID=2904250 RepID=UPI001F29EEE8|nr:hypothetical protein [Microbulbifer sediminum]